MNRLAVHRTPVELSVQASDNQIERTIESLGSSAFTRSSFIGQ
jgi:hypothetical protein